MHMITLEVGIGKGRKIKKNEINSCLELCIVGIL